MASKYMTTLSKNEREDLIQKLWDIQNGICFITEDHIDLEIHSDSLDIDHIIPLSSGGKDVIDNFALTFSSANRSKQSADLELARILDRFRKLKEKIKKENRNPDLNDVLKEYSGAKYDLNFSRESEYMKFSFADLGKTDIIKIPIYKDNLSGIEYFFANFPLEYLHHDNIINPRSIGTSISKLISEFYLKNPQLHISLAWIDIEESTKTYIKIFDGQHKAAAQAFLGIKEIPVRVFINPNKDKLTETNFKAGTTLRQVAFDKSVQRHLGNTMYKDRVKKYQDEHRLTEENYSFSEKTLIKFFKGESREMKRYILDSIRDSITHDSNNKLKEYIDFGGRAKDKPLSYSSVEKTFFSFFIHGDALDTNIDYKLEEGLNPRHLEGSQITQLMNIIAEELLIEKFDFDIGIHRIEYKMRNGEKFPSDHIRAYRMVKEEILYNWLKYIRQIVYHFFTMHGHVIQEEKLFQNEFDNVLWDNVRNFIKNLAKLPIWVNPEYSSIIFGGKQNYNFWHDIFSTGRSPQGTDILIAPLNTIEMIKGEEQ